MNNNENCDACDACDASTGRGISYFEVKTATTSELNSIIEHDNLENNSKKQKNNPTAFSESESHGSHESQYGTHGLPITNGYTIIEATPATGILYEINGFLSGHVRMRGRGNGFYPFYYLEMLDHVFGTEEKTIEVCSGTARSYFTVDINPEHNPDLVADGQLLSAIQANSFNRWRCDPPYNVKTAKEMYGTELPSLGKLLTEGARVVKPGSLMFLLCSQNYQWCPSNCKRIGLVYISVIPNNETRILNIYVKKRPINMKMKKWLKFVEVCERN